MHNRKTNLSGHSKVTDSYLQFFYLSYKNNAGFTDLILSFQCHLVLSIISAFLLKLISWFILSSLIYYFSKEGDYLIYSL